MHVGRVMMAKSMRWSLSAFVAVCSLLAVAAAMGVYAVFEYLLSPRANAFDLAFHHSWHTAAVGIVIYAILSAVLHGAVVRPIRAIHGHIYRVATGKVVPLRVATRIREIRSLVAVVNVMVQRIQLSSRDLGLDPLVAQVEALEQLADAIVAQAPEVTQEIRNRTEKLRAGLLLAPIAINPLAAEH